MEINKLNLNIDISDIEHKILNLKTEYEDFLYVPYGKSLEFGDKALNEEEYNENIETFLNEFREAAKNPNKIIDDFPKKKNGTFNRKNVVYLAECKNCVAIHEWHNTWIYYAVKVKARNDTILDVTFEKITDTPC